MRMKLKEIRGHLGRSIFVGERYDQNLRSMTVVAAILVVLGIVLTVINLVNWKGWDTVATSAAFAVFGAVALYFVKVARKRIVFVVVMSIAVVGVLTYDVLFVNNQFAFLWTLLVPMAACYLLGIHVGYGLTAYFQLLFTVLFYTPLRQYVAGHYSEILLSRFPLLYFFNGLITVFVMYEYHKSVLFAIDHADRLHEEVERQTGVAVERARKIERVSYEVVEALAKAVDAKDKYTNGHSFRVAAYADALAIRLGWSEEERALLKREALLHDVGKIGIPDAVLNKPGRLTDEEFAAIKSHTTIGEEILSGLEDLTDVADVAMHHHERYDGKGYPTGLSGTNISDHARVVAIADAYDAMSSDRIYRKALPPDFIRGELVRQRGSQFDPDFVDAFLHVIDDGVPA